MNVLLSTRSWHVALIMFILSFANVSFAETKSKTYDTKQLIRDVAVLYRKHKLEEASKPAKSVSASPVQTAKNDSKTNKRVSRKTLKQAKRSARKLAKAKKRKARRLARARNILKSRKKSWKDLNSPSKVAKKRRLDSFRRQMTVTATAYTSHVNQTDSTPNIAAWGDRLKPGMKVIAVSRDMLDLYGLKHRSKVRIKGLDGEYLVLDKMNKRWKKKIDIYMGKDLKKAFKWGRKKVELQWN